MCLTASATCPPGPHTHRICNRCIMDTSDPTITFDERGVCNHCRRYGDVVADYVFHGEDGRRRLDEIVGRIKQEGKGKRYDCIIGLSGGVDSTYVAYLVKKMGLRPLAVHLDNGWNSEAAVRNIENIIRILEIDLHTEVLDWEEFRRLQVAFLRASTPDSEVPTDHAIVATLYRTAIREKVRYIISGSNFVTELMVPVAWSNGHTDWKYISTVNRMFGGRRLKTYPHYSFFDLRIRFPVLKGLRDIQILNYVDYNKFDAIETMQRELGWVNYGGKHYESIYTRFYQGYLLPTKFGFDKRRSHLSCLINNGLITREQALAEIQKPPIDETQLRDDRAFVLKKLGLSEEEFEEIMASPPLRFEDYPSYEQSLDKNLWWRAAVSMMIRTKRLGTRLGLFR